MEDLAQVPYCRDVFVYSLLGELIVLEVGFCITRSCSSFISTTFW